MPDEWLASVPGIREHEPLARYSWYRIGGRARYFLEVSDDAKLPQLVARLNAEGCPYLAIGAATNTLFAADELPGLTIKLDTEAVSMNGDTVSVSAGYLMPRLAAETARAGRAGLEFGAGVPGTVGGSVFGNAGAFGSEIKDSLLSAEVIDEAGRHKQIPVVECGFAYRDSVFKSRRDRWVITKATFATRPESPQAVRARLLEVQKHRRATQPIEERSLGSTFKNPPGDSAGRLIDAAGLKGFRIGGAQVSPKHANFIVNLGGATADDVLALVAEMRRRVLERFGIELEPEIRVIGRAPAG
ncbi:MAG TPA: UDP-N-acetylmuramate dehydrogenase [Candidatus Dormibacteraeota bacterium]|nr:UDP-N-acetylmuramate dehydrogenase [Candidatus Dormibacteraeota bacterium]